MNWQINTGVYIVNFNNFFSPPPPTGDHFFFPILMRPEGPILARGPKGRACSEARRAESIGGGPGGRGPSENFSKLGFKSCFYRAILNILDGIFPSVFLPFSSPFNLFPFSSTFPFFPFSSVAKLGFKMVLLQSNFEHIRRNISLRFSSLFLPF